MTAAWFCPACQKHHAPHVETCPGGTGGAKSTADVLADYKRFGWSPIGTGGIQSNVCMCTGACRRTGVCPNAPRGLGAASAFGNYPVKGAH